MPRRCTSRKAWPLAFSTVAAAAEHGLESAVKAYNNVHLYNHNHVELRNFRQRLNQPKVEVGTDDDGRQRWRQPTGVYWIGAETDCKHEPKKQKKIIKQISCSKVYSIFFSKHTFFFVSEENAIRGGLVKFVLFVPFFMMGAKGIDGIGEIPEPYQV